MCATTSRTCHPAPRLGICHAPGGRSPSIAASSRRSAATSSLELPAVSLTAGEASRHFSFLAPLVSIDSSASSALTREQLGWLPTHPGLIADIEEGHYFKQ